MQNETKYEQTYVTCIHCQKNWGVKVPAKGFREWNDGKLIQDAMPELSTASRELLISKTCPECWERLFGGGE